MKESDKQKVVENVLKEIRGELTGYHRINAQSKDLKQAADAQSRVDAIETVDKNNENNMNMLEDLVGQYVSLLPEESIKTLAKGKSINSSASPRKLAEDVLRGIENHIILAKEKSSNDFDIDEANKAGLKNFVEVGNVTKYVQRNFDYINSDIKTVLKNNCAALGLDQQMASNPKDKRLTVLAMNLGDSGLDKNSEMYKSYSTAKTQSDSQMEITLVAKNIGIEAKKQTKESSAEGKKRISDVPECKAYLDYKDTVVHLTAGIIAGLVEADGKNPSSFTLGQSDGRDGNITTEVLSAIIDIAAELAKKEEYKTIKPNGLLLAGKEIGKAARDDLYEFVEQAKSNTKDQSANYSVPKEILKVTAENLEIEKNSKKPHFAQSVAEEQNTEVVISRGK